MALNSTETVCGEIMWLKLLHTRWESEKRTLQLVTTHEGLRGEPF